MDELSESERVATAPVEIELLYSARGPADSSFADELTDSEVSSSRQS